MPHIGCVQCVHCPNICEQRTTVSTVIQLNSCICREMYVLPFFLFSSFELSLSEEDSIPQNTQKLCAQLKCSISIRKFVPNHCTKFLPRFLCTKMVRFYEQHAFITTMQNCVNINGSESEPEKNKMKRHSFLTLRKIWKSIDWCIAISWWKMEKNAHESRVSGNFLTFASHIRPLIFSAYCWNDGIFIWRICSYFKNVYSIHEFILNFSFCAEVFLRHRRRVACVRFTLKMFSCSEQNVTSDNDWGEQRQNFLANVYINLHANRKGSGSPLSR